MVRQWIVTPLFAGSSPVVRPASQFFASKIKTEQHLWPSGRWQRAHNPYQFDNAGSNPARCFWLVFWLHKVGFLLIENGTP